MKVCCLFEILELVLKERLWDRFKQPLLVTSCVTSGNSLTGFNLKSFIDKMGVIIRLVSRISMKIHCVKYTKSL